MLTLDHVHTLEGKIEQAVQMLQALTKECNGLKVSVAEKQKRIQELEQLVVSLRDGQDKMEEGILHALDRLSAFEDSVHTDGVRVESKRTVEKVQSNNTSDKPTNTADASKEQMEIF